MMRAALSVSGLERPMEKRNKWILSVFFLGISLFFLVWALSGPGVSGHGAGGDDADEILNEGPARQESALGPLTALSLAGGWSSLMIIFSLIFGRKFSDHQKRIIFFLIALPVFLATLVLLVSTISKNLNSATRGPVHWHADYQVWICGKEYELADPEGIMNRVGTSELHEHNDRRIHIEGVLDNLEDGSLGAYFRAIGGMISPAEVTFPSAEGMIHFDAGDLCPDSSPGNVKVFVNGKRAAEPQEYVPSPEINVPPGDCIIIDFSPGEEPMTERICQSWAAKGWSYTGRGGHNAD